MDWIAKMSSSFSWRFIVISHRVSIRKTFAQFLRNETQNFSFFAHQFCAKKNINLRNHSQKSFRAKMPYSAFRNSCFAQFRSFVKIKRLVTVCVSYNSILEESCFGMSSYWSLLNNWPMTLKKSSNLTIFSTILVLDMHIS